jgi:cyclic-di-GMP phosphodiesterase TipF (flagellum assembly factor)
MPKLRKRPDFQPEPPQAAGETGTLISMALVVAAIVVGLNVQMGLSMGLAALAGMSLFIGLVGFYAWRRGEADRAALADQLFQLESELHSRGPAQGPGYRHGSGHLPEEGHVPVAGVTPTRSIVSGPSLTAAAIVPPPPGLQPDSGIGSDIETADRWDAVAVSRVAVPHFEAYRGAPDVAPGESLADYWQSQEAAAAFSRSANIAVSAPMEPAPLAAPSAVREDDVEMLQRRIKDMLHQVTVAEQARDFAAARPEEPVVHATPVDMAVSSSIDALQAAAQSMRRGPATPTVFDEPAETRQPPADPQLLAVREAIAAGRVEVFLEPILGLGNQATQHYEVSIGLRGADGQDLGSGAGDVIAGRGLLPLFDAARIERSAIVAERLQSRGKNGAVFSRASGEALIEQEFTRNMQLDFVTRPATARQLILSFSQADIRAFRAAEQRAVSALAALGFRFAISSLTDLDMNFAAMAQAGFAFVKIDAVVMLDGLPHPGGHIPANDVCRFLADQGFGLIVEGIDSEETLAKVFGFGVLMGQGTLFGGRRPVKADVAARRGQAAA